MSRKFLRIALWVSVAFLLLALGLVVYLRNADLSIYKDRIESFVSGAIGREFEIAGRFELHVGGITRIVAEEISLPASSEDALESTLDIGHVTFAFDTWSMFADTFVVEELLVRDVTARIVATPDEEGAESGGDVATDRIAVRKVEISGVDLAWHDPSTARSIHAQVDSLTILPDAEDVLDLELRGELNELPLEADGKLGPWPNLISGKDISANLSLGLAQLRLVVAGTVADATGLDGISAEASLTGPEIGRVIERLGLPPFAAGAFDLAARVESVADGQHLKVEGNLGAIDVSAEGNVDRFLGTEAADVDFGVAGPDTQYVAELFGVTGAPAEPFRVGGGVAMSGRQLTFRTVRIEVGPNTFGVDGALDFEAVVPDGRMVLTADGPDVSVLGPFLDVSGLPALPFGVAGEVRKSGDDWEVNGFEGSVGANRITAGGSMTVGSSEGSAIEFRVTGPDISFLQDFTDLNGLPARPYDITARLRSSAQGVAVEGARIVVGDNQLEVDGVISGRAGLAGTRMQVHASGPELREVAALAGVPYLPAGPFDVAGQVGLDVGLVRFAEVRARVGELEATASGSAGFGAHAGDFELTTDVRGRDVARLLQLDALQPFAGEAFSVAGGFRSTGDALELTQVKVAVGEYHADVDGTLNLSPMSNDSDMQFRFYGPSMERVGKALDTDLLLDKPFDVSGRFAGTPTGFAVQDFAARVGDSDVRGQFTADLQGKPRIKGTLESEMLDLRERQQLLTDEAQEAEAEPEDTSEFVFSDEPFDTAPLQLADIDIDLKVGRLVANSINVLDFHLGLQLQDGTLRIDPVSMTQIEGGRLDGQVSLVPAGDGLELNAALSTDRLHLGLLADENQDRAKLPPISGKAELRGSGMSLHQLLAKSNGLIDLRQGSGEMRELFVAVIFRDVLSEVLRTINPLHHEQNSRKLDCAFYNVGIVDGVATMNRVALQTDRLLLLVTGDVNLETEKLNINFQASPREGIGISLGTVANSFLGVRNTLKSPKVVVDPKSSVTTTGVAVATGGLSLLAKGLKDRLEAEKDICGEANAP